MRIDPARTLQSTGLGRAPVDDVEARIEELAPWFHNLHLPSGHQTAPDHPLGDYPSYKWRQIAPNLPDDLSGQDVLDVGCNAGFYTFEVARRGARVLAIDHDAHYLEQAAWASSMFGLDDLIQFAQMGAYDLADLDQTFDLVLFLGVLYHLRYPLLGLDLVSSKVAGTLILQTLTSPGGSAIDVPDDLDIDERELLTRPGWPSMAFIENRLAGDPTNWWAPNEACVEAMARSCGFIPRRVAHEIFICERDPGATTDRAEMEAVMRAPKRRRREP